MGGIGVKTFREVVDRLHRLRDQLCNRVKRDSQPKSPAQLNGRLLPGIPFSPLFYREPDPMHDADIKFYIYHVVYWTPLTVLTMKIQLHVARTMTTI